MVDLVWNYLKYFNQRTFDWIFSTKNQGLDVITSQILKKVDEKDIDDVKAQIEKIWNKKIPKYNYIFTEWDMEIKGGPYSNILVAKVKGYLEVYSGKKLVGRELKQYNLSFVNNDGFLSSLKAIEEVND
jgi:hypothetical protein